MFAYLLTLFLPLNDAPDRANCTCYSCSSQDGRQMMYLPLLLVNELSFSVRDLVVGRLICTNFSGPTAGNVRNLHIDLVLLAGDQQQHPAAASHRVLWRNLSEEVQVLDPSAWHCLFFETVWWVNIHLYLHQPEVVVAISVCFCTGFTEENIDEIKDPLMGSNLYLLVLSALITVLQVRKHTFDALFLQYNNFFLVSSANLWISGS